MPKSALQFGSYDYHDRLSRGVHPPALFATANEVLDTHNLADKQSESTEELMEDKLYDADSLPGVGYDVPEEFHEEPEDERQSGWYGGLSARIKEHGYDWSKPVEAVSFGAASTISDGHHRLAVMQRDRPDEFIPLKYKEPEF